MWGRSNWLVGVTMLIVTTRAMMAQPQLPAPIAGTGSVSGMVTNSATGAPLPQAHVTLLVLGAVPGSSPGNMSAQNFSAVTDAGGKFTIGQLPAGRLIINVARAGFVTPSAGNRLSTSQLMVDQKLEDVKLTLTPTGGISGRVLNADGVEVQGAIVSLDGSQFGINPAVTDEKGRFRINSVPPGSYRVAANPAVMPFPPEIRSDGTQEVHDARTYYPEGLTAKTGQRVEVGAGVEVTGVDIRLVRTPIVTLSGKVVDAPVGGKTSVRAVASVAAGGGVRMANNVKADGSFQIWQLDPGKYTVVATNSTQGAPQRSVQSTPVEVEVEGADIRNIELRMIQPFDVAISLRYDDDGARDGPPMPGRQGQGAPPLPQGAQRPPAARRISLRPEGQVFAYAPSISQPAEIANDSLTLEKLQPGRYRLMPSWGVYVKSVAMGGTETDGDILDLRNGPGGPVTVRIGSVTGEVSGVVNDSSGPAPGVGVVMIGEGSSGRLPIFAMSAPDGAYKFAAVPPGSYRLVAGDNDMITQFRMGTDMEDYAAVTESIEVHPGDKLTKALTRRVSGER